MYCFVSSSQRFKGAGYLYTSVLKATSSCKYVLYHLSVSFRVCTRKYLFFYLYHFTFSRMFTAHFMFTGAVGSNIKGRNARKLKDFDSLDVRQCA